MTINRQYNQSVDNSVSYLSQIVLNKRSSNYDIENETNELLLRFTYYCSEDLYDGYKNKDLEEFIISIKKFKISWDNYKIDKSILLKFMFWLKYLPYWGHKNVLIEILKKHTPIMESLFANKNIFYCDYVMSKLNRPIERVLLFRFEEWISYMVTNDCYKVDEIAYEISKFILDYIEILM